MHSHPRQPLSSASDPAATLTELVFQALQSHPAGISEYDLMQWLKMAGHKKFQDIAFGNRLSLFQSHFILFHALYQLKQKLWQEDLATLEINPLKIILLPVDRTAGTDIDSHDPMMDYYLDISNLKNTTDRDLAELLTYFWRTLGNNEQRAAALSELELEDPVDYTTIKQQHRRLVMRHHPDRGGDKEKLQVINAAMDLLQKIHEDKTAK
ncbi:DNA-J related domain-containing protein [Kaarinaea lacus]